MYMKIGKRCGKGGEKEKKEKERKE